MDSPNQMQPEAVRGPGGFVRFLRGAAWIGIILGAILVIGSLFLESSYASRARKVQLVEPSEAAAIFGDKGDMIGTPQMMIIDDPKAFLSGDGPDGSVLADNNYLKRQKIYPLQLKTVNYFAYWVRLGSAVAMLVSVGTLFLTRRPRQNRVAAV